MMTFLWPCLLYSRYRGYITNLAWENFREILIRTAEEFELAWKSKGYEVTEDLVIELVYNSFEEEDVVQTRDVNDIVVE